MLLLFAIIGINIVYVSLNTLRTIFVIKGRRLLASSLSMIEVFVYLTGLSIVLKNLDGVWNIVAYCVGYAIGVFVGSKIEEKLALGYLNIQVVVDSLQCDLPDILREKGYGVTSWIADGKDGKRLIMQVLAKRCNECYLLNFLHEIAPNAFVISYEPKHFKGGFWVKNVGNM